MSKNWIALRNNGDECKRLAELMDLFEAKRAEVLLAKHRDGYTGWDNLNYTDRFVQDMHRVSGQSRISDKDLLHIANWAMFIWGIRRKHPESIPKYYRDTPKGVVRGCNSCGYGLDVHPYCKEPKYRKKLVGTCWGPEFKCWKPRRVRKTTKRKGKKCI